MFIFKYNWQWQFFRINLTTHIIQILFKVEMANAIKEEVKMKVNDIQNLIHVILKATSTTTTIALRCVGSLLFPFRCPFVTRNENETAMESWSRGCGKCKVMLMHPSVHYPVGNGGVSAGLVVRLGPWQYDKGSVMSHFQNSR